VKDFLFQKRQFLLYCIIGTTCTCIDFGTYSILIKTKVLDYQAANCISYSCGTVCSFFLNARFNFRMTDRMAQRLASFLTVGLIGYLVSAGMLHVLVGHNGFNKYLSKAATLVVVVLIQYNLNKMFSFRKAG
jgi:putative flippase GtrA